MAVVDESASSLLSSGESMGQLMGRLNGEAKEHGEAIVAEAPPEVEVETDVIRGTAVYRAIVGYAEEVGADLLVMGSTGRGGIGGLLGSTTQRVTENTGGGCSPSPTRRRGRTRTARSVTDTAPAPR